jgi:hypothetical protein
VPETPGATSSMLDTALRVNYCETRCQLIGDHQPPLSLRSLPLLLSAGFPNVWDVTLQD